MRICSDPRTGKGCGAVNRDDAKECRICGMPLFSSLRIYNPGDQIQQYQIIHIIGYGKFGAVYEAQHRNHPGVSVALKETLHPDSLRIFQREFEALRQAVHHNLPRYYGWFVEQGRGYLVMDLVPGQNLQDMLNRRREAPGGRREPLPEDVVVEGYAVQLCAALSYLHSMQPPILHRDIKPANIRVTPTGVIKLVDFGLLKYAGDKTHMDIRGIGTAPYAPIEQYASNGQNTDQRSDIYSLGAVLYHLLTGQMPTSASVRRSATSDPLPPPEEYVPTISPHVSEALMIAMSPRKEDRYATVAAFKQALLTPRPTSAFRPLHGHSGGVRSVSFSTDGRHLASSSSSWSVRLWDMLSGRVICTLKGHSGKVNSVDYSPDGQWLASGSSGSTVRLWDAENGTPITMLHGHIGAVRSVAWSPDARQLASAGDDRLIQIWNMANQRQRVTLRGHLGGVRSVVWSPDGMRLASGSTDQTARVWQLNDGSTQFLLRGHRGAVRSVAWSPNGKLLATGSSDETIRMWDANDGRLLFLLEGHTDLVNSVAFSPDARILISAGDDHKIRIWRVSDGSLLSVLPGHAGVINDVAYSPDGQMFVTGGDDRIIRQWSVPEVREISA